MNARGAVRVLLPTDRELAERHGIDLSRIPEAWTVPPGHHQDPEAGALPRAHHTDPILSQTFCDARSDDGSQTAAQYKVAGNSNWYEAPGTKFRLRVCIQETAAAADSTTAWQLQYNKNAAGWNNVTGSSSVVRATSSAHVTDGTATTSFSYMGTGTFVAGSIDTSDGVASSTAIGASGHTEVEFCCALQAADVADGDTVEFRVVKSGGTVFTGTYTTRTLTVAKVTPAAWSSQTIPGVSGAVDRQGPFLQGSAVYAVGATSSEVAMYKAASDPTNSASWSAVGSYALVTQADQVRSVYAMQDGTDIHVLHTEWNGTVGRRVVYFSTFDTTTDTWSRYMEVAGSGTQSSIGTFTGTGGGMAKRSDGKFVIAFTIPSTGDSTIAIVIRNQTGNGSAAAWTSPGTLTAASGDKESPVLVTGASDRVHIFYMIGAELRHRSVSSADAYDTDTSIASSLFGTLAGAAYDGTSVFVLATNSSGTLRSYHATSGATPTWTGSDASGSNGRANDGWGAIVDGSTWRAVVGYHSTDTSLRSNRRSGAGGSWEAALTVEDNTETFRHVHANIYTRSGSKVIGVLRITSAAGALAYKEYAADAAVHATAQPGAVAVVVGVPQPTPGEWQRITPAAVAAVASVPTPSISAGSSVTPTPTAVTAAVDTPTPVVDVSAQRTPDPVAAIVSLPTPDARAASRVTPDRVALVVAVETPSLSAGSKVTPDPAALVASVPTPAPSLGTTTTPGEVAAVAALPTPTPRAGADRTPDAVAVVVAVEGPTILATSSVTPAAVDVDVAIPTPSLSAASSVTPSAVASVVAVPTPTPVASVSRTPSEVALIVAIETPAISAGSTVTPSETAAVASVPTPSVSAASAVAPAEVAVVVAVEIPSVAIASTRSPDPVAAIVQVPTPITDSSQHATPTPDAVAVDAEVPTPVVSAGSTVTPEEVEAVVTGPTPVLSAEVVTMPTAVEIVVALPTPDAGAAARALPEEVEVVASLPGPTPSASSVVTPGPVGAIVSVLGVTLEVSSVVGPATVETVIAADGPAALVSTTVTPGEVVAFVSLPLPSIAAEAVVAPGTVLAVVSIPSPTVPVTVVIVARRCDVVSPTARSEDVVSSSSRRASVVAGDSRRAAVVAGSSRRADITEPSDRRVNEP